MKTWRTGLYGSSKKAYNNHQNDWITFMRRAGHSNTYNTIFGA